MISPENSSDSQSGDNLIEGIFCVKISPNFRCKNLWKVWSCKLVRLEFIKSSWLSSESIILTVFKSTKTKTVLLREKLNPNRTILYRCKSRKKPYAFTIYSDGRTLIHISGESESESQKLMKLIRNLISPPNPVLLLTKALARVFDVSTIDNERSIRAGLLGASGNLTLTEKKAILSCTRTGQVMQEWYLHTINFEFLKQKLATDDGKVVMLVGNQESSTGQGSIIFYCENGPILVRQASMIKMHNQSTSISKFASCNDTLNISPIRAMFQRSMEINQYDEIPRRQSNNSLISPYERPISKDSSSGYRTCESLENSLSNSLPAFSWPKKSGFDFKFAKSLSHKTYQPPPPPLPPSNLAINEAPESASFTESFLNCSVNFNSNIPERFYANIQLPYNNHLSKISADNDDAHIYEEIKPKNFRKTCSHSRTIMNNCSNGSKVIGTWPKNGKIKIKDKTIDTAVSEYHINDMDDYCVIEKFDCMNLQKIPSCKRN